MFKTMADVKRANKAAGGHFFDRDTVRFFNGRIEGGPYGGRYFVDSTQFVDVNRGFSEPRRYHVREIHANGRIDLVSDHATKAEAVAVAKGTRTNPRRSLRNPATNTGIVDRRRNPRAAPVDHDVVDGLVLYAENDEYLWNYRRGAFVENLRKKLAKGKYDRNAAVKLWTYYADDVAKHYAREFGEPMPSPATRKAAAAEFRDIFEQQAKHGDFALPADWQRVPRHLHHRMR